MCSRRSLQATFGSPELGASTKRTNERFISKKKLLKKLELWDGSRRLMNIPETGMVAIPIASKQNDPQKLLSVIMQKISSEEEIDLQIKELDLPTAKKLLVRSPETILVESLTRLFEEDGLRLTDPLRLEIPDHWERHGDLILLPEKAFSSEQWKQFEDRLWLTVCKSLQCRRLARKSVVSQDGFRSPQVTLLCGEDGWVEQVDNGIRYTYDVTRCMFSSGNITEKLRVAKFDCRDETVVDLYAGIGYFTLPYLIHTGAKHLHACEWNPDAVEALQRNLKLNGVDDRCTIHFGDNRKVCPENVADRVNLGLIPSSEPGWRTACAALKSDTGGILHIHGNVNTKTRHGERPVGDNLDRPDDTVDIVTHLRTENDVTDIICSTTTKHTEGAFSDNFVGADNALNIVTDSKSGICAKNVNDDIRTESHKRAVGEKLDSGGGARYNVIPTGYENNCLDFHINTKTKLSESNIGINSEDICDVKSANNIEKSLKTLFPFNKHEENTDSLKMQSSHDENIHHVENGSKLQPPPNKTLNNIEDNLKMQSLCDTGVGNSKWLPWAKEVSDRIRNILRNLHDTDWRTEILHIEHVKSYAPHVDHVVLDLKCSPFVQ